MQLWRVEHDKPKEVVHPKAHRRLDSLSGIFQLHDVSQLKSIKQRRHRIQRASVVRRGVYVGVKSMSGSL